MQSSKIDRPVAELQKCGFVIKPWWAAAAIAEVLGGPQRDMRMFERGTIHGLLEVCTDALNVISLNNERPNNGQFTKAIVRLERAADSLRVKLRIVEFWNDRLRLWFVRRGYESGRHPEWGLYAERPLMGKQQLTPAQRTFSDRHSAGLGEWIKSGHNRSALD